MKITDESVQAAMDATRGRISPIMLEIALNAALPHLQPVDVAAVRRQAFEEAGTELEINWGHRATPEMRDAIRALSAEPAQGEQWQPIETAPKDGTDVLLRRGLGMPPVVAGWYDCAWKEFSRPEKAVTNVTHWMPLPAAPAPEAEA